MSDQMGVPPILSQKSNTHFRIKKQAKTLPPLASREQVSSFQVSSFKFIKFAGKSLYNNHLLQIAS